MSRRPHNLRRAFTPPNFASIAEEEATPNPTTTTTPTHHRQLPFDPTLPMDPSLQKALDDADADLYASIDPAILARSPFANPPTTTAAKDEMKYEAQPDAAEETAEKEKVEEAERKKGCLASLGGFFTSCFAYAMCVPCRTQPEACCTEEGCCRLCLQCGPCLLHTCCPCCACTRY